MKIPAASLSDGTHTFVFDEEAPSIGLGPEFSPVHVQVTADKSASGLSIHAAIATRVACTCDRCLGGFELSLEPSFRMEYVYSEGMTEGRDPAEVQVIDPATTVVEITEDVRQTTLIAVPFKLLCAESCKGLCPQCGKNLNDGPCDCRPEPSDPRWDALRDLRLGS